jgi:hypothetical protein
LYEEERSSVKKQIHNMPEKQRRQIEFIDEIYNKVVLKK